MVYVRPTNKKLIDRSIRYVNFLLEEHDLHPPSYEQICESVFEVFDQSKVDEPVVMKVFEKLKSQISAKNGSTKILNLSKESSKS
jgi:N-acetylmuramic acid 6-phosphate etherase